MLSGIPRATQFARQRLLRAAYFALHHVLFILLMDLLLGSAIVFWYWYNPQFKDLGPRDFRDEMSGMHDRLLVASFILKISWKYLISNVGILPIHHWVGAQTPPSLTDTASSVEEYMPNWCPSYRYISTWLKQIPQAATGYEPMIPWHDGIIQMHGRDHGTRLSTGRRPDAATQSSLRSLNSGIVISDHSLNRDPATGYYSDQSSLNASRTNRDTLASRQSSTRRETPHLARENQIPARIFQRHGPPLSYPTLCYLPNGVRYFSSRAKAPAAQDSLSTGTSQCTRIELNQGKGFDDDWAWETLAAIKAAAKAAEGQDQDDVGDLLLFSS